MSLDSELTPGLRRARAALARQRSAYAPPPRLTVSEFADREIVVTSGPLAGTHWQTAFAPYQRGIMDAVHEPGVEFIVVMGSSQWGKTSCAVNVVAYFMAHDPSPILVVEPTVDPMAKDFSRVRLRPVIEASPALKSRVSKLRSRDAANTMLQIQFQGGDIAIGGANSAASLAARARRILILDEIDRYPHELSDEGSTIEIALTRTRAFSRRRKVMMLSSPTITGAPIHAWFERGDRRRYHVPCPACGDAHPYRWRDVRWTDDDPDTARIHCPTCGHGLDDAERVAALGRGTWIADAPERRQRDTVSFHLWAAYSPLERLADGVRAFLRAREEQKRGDRAVMHTWSNVVLGEPVDPDDGQGVEPHVLLARREPYEAPAPEGVAAITLGVDVQDDRLEVLAVGWGPGEEAWLLDRGLIPGDTSRPEPWDGLAEALRATYRHAGSEDLPVAAMCVDSGGHRTSEVYEFVHKHQAQRVFATIGRDGQRPVVSSPSPRKWGRGLRQVPLYTIGIDAAKALLLSRLALTEAGPGFVHVPVVDWADHELAEQLTSERLVTRFVRGVPHAVWQLVRPGAHNEMLDAWVLALAALRLTVATQLERLHVELLARASDRAAGHEPGPPPPPPARPRWLGDRRQWFTRR
jgi:phage terminase large subunit GpA-like protein